MEKAPEDHCKNDGCVVALKNLRGVCQYFDSRVTETGTKGSKPCQGRAGYVKSFEHGSTLDFWIGGESGRRISNGGFMSNLINSSSILHRARGTIVLGGSGDGYFLE